MRLKYYLRGAGCGILVSAILFAAFLTIMDWGPRNGAASKTADDSKVLVGQTAADAAEAEEKQQVEKDGENLANASGKTSAAESDKKKSGDGKDKDQKYVEKDPPGDADDEEPYGPEGEEPNEDDDASDTRVRFAIRNGEGSYTIASNLVSAGLLDNASQFDAYLSERGYDHILRTGEFDIEPGLTYDEIAKILVGK